MLSIKQEIELQTKGTGAKAMISDLEAIERAGKKAGDELAKTKNKVGEFADKLGRTSTTLARSADAFGLPAGALRTLDDVMDVTELGFTNMSKSALSASVSVKSFQLSLLGPIAAAAAVGAALGALLNKFQFVRDGADKLVGTFERLAFGMSSADQLKGATAGLKDFQKAIGASNLEALQKQVAAMRDQGKSVKEITAFYKGTLNPELMKRLGLTEQAAKAEQKILAANEKQKQTLESMKAILSHQAMTGEEAARRAATVDFKREMMLPGLATSISTDRMGGVTAGGAGIPMSQLMGGGLATSISLSYSQTRDLERKSAEAAKAAAEKLVGSLGTLANQLTNLSQTVGGVAGKILNVMASLSSGAGGILSGVDAWKSAKGAGGGLLGFLGKFSAGLGIVGSAIGAVGGLIGGIKSLFGGKSKEQKAAEEQARKQAEADRKAAADEKARLKVEGLKSAQSAAESLMGRMGEGVFSDKLTALFGQITGKVQDALLASGLGFMPTGPLRDSKEFGAAQGAAGDVAAILAAMRQAGALDAGLLGATAQSAEELRAQAVAAAEAAGLEPAEATKAGFGAIAPLLREQLNAALASGQELDANTKALIEEAKKNGVTILADPMVESVAVQKQMLGELRDMNRSGGGAPDQSFASGSRGLRLVKRDMLAQIHEGEGFLVVPRDQMGRMSLRSFAKGSDGESGREPGRDFGTDPVSLPSDWGKMGDSAGAGAGAGATSTAAAAQTTVIQANVTSAPVIQITDQSLVKTVEGQRAFGRYVVDEVDRAFKQSNQALEGHIERIVRRVNSGN